jgi:hypothetical protein
MLKVLDKPSAELMLSTEPVYTVDSEGWYVFDIFRGSDTDNLEGISWFSTSYATALVYANNTNGFIQHRRIRIPAENGFLVNPNDYLLGGRSRARGYKAGQVDTDIDTYYYGLSEDIYVEEEINWHFDMSIHESMLKAMSYEVARYERTQLPSSPRSITFNFNWDGDS